MSSETDDPILHDILRTAAGVAAIFVAYWLGVIAGDSLFPSSGFANRMEPMASKIGASVAVFLAGLVLRRYVIRTLTMAAICLLLVEILVALIIDIVNGFDLWWLYALTWNVVLTFIAGTVLGQFWAHKKG